MRRTLRLFKDAHPVQRILDDAQKLKERYSKVLGKRHTIKHQNYMEMIKDIKDYNITTPLAEFKRAANELPKIEKEVELSYLHQMSEHLTAPEKEELMQSWKERERISDQRKYVSRMHARPISVFDQEKPITRPNFELPDPVNPTENEIGKFFTIDETLANKIYLNGAFGEFFTDHYSKCDTFDIMMREETLRIINSLKAGQNINNKYFPALHNNSVLKDLEPIQRLGWLIKNHAKSYLDIYRKIAWLINDLTYNSSDLKLRKIVGNSPDLFESTVAVVVQELAKSQLFNVICKDLTFEDPESSIESLLVSEDLRGLVDSILSFYSEKVTSAEDYLSVIHFSDFVNHISPKIYVTVKETPIEISLAQYLESRFSYPEELETALGPVKSLTTGTILTGMKGSGKSQILAGVCAWALSEGNYVIVKIPRGSDFTRNACALIWEPNGFYMQPEVAYDILKEILEINGEKLTKLRVDPKIYGKFSLSGVHPEYDKDYESLPNQHVYVQEYRVWSDKWKEYYPEDFMEELFKGVRSFDLPPRISRFEYEKKRWSEELIPKVFSEVMDGESVLKNIKLSDLFSLETNKRKPKKIMLPKDSSDVVKFSLTPKRIDTQDLCTAEDVEDNTTGEYLQPLRTVCENPLTLRDLVEFGIKNHTHAVNVLFEVMEHLYRSDEINTLVLVDEFNELYQASEYPSMKYMNYKETNGCIPPYDVSLGRLFMKFNGHTIKNGMKIVATSEKTTSYNTTNWVGDPLNLGPHFSVEVGKLPLDDLRTLLEYYNYFGRNDQLYLEYDIAAIHMQAQGNFGLILEGIDLSPEKTY